MGGAYKFRLQKLLDIREKEEEEQKIAFMKAVKAKNEVEENLKNLEGNLEVYSKISNNMSTTERKIQFQYINLLSSTIDLTKDRLKVHEKKVEKERNELVTAQVNRKIVNILKEKDKTKFENEEKHKEQIQNDEFALYGYIREGERR